MEGWRGACLPSWRGSIGSSRSNSKSNFNSDLKRTQSRPNLITKDKSSIARQLEEFAHKDLIKAAGRSTARIEEALQRHNSCSLISTGKKERTRPAIVKVEHAGEMFERERESTTSRLAKHIASKPESNYQSKKRPLTKKRSSNMLFSKLGFVTQGQNVKLGNIITSRKQSDIGSNYAKKQSAYLMSRISPKSQVSGGAEPYFRFDFLDYSETGNPVNQNSSKERMEIKRVVSGEILPSSSFRKAFGGRTKIVQKDQLDQSTSSSSLPIADTNQDLISAKMAETLHRFSELIKVKQIHEQEQLRRFEAIARENGILRDQIKSLERR